MVSRWRGFSPSAAAMSAIERSMSVVEIGSSQLSARMPNAPPAAPEAAAANLCMRSLDGFAGPSAPSEVTAMSSALRSAASVAWWTLDCRRAGNIFRPFSTGDPTMFESFAAMPGFSSSCFARLSSSRSAFGRDMVTL